MSDTIITSRLEGTRLIVESERQNVESYDSQFLVAALLIFIARGSGRIEPEETAKMLDLIQEHFQLAGAETLELLTRAMSELAEKPELGGAARRAWQDPVRRRQRGHCRDGAQGHRRGWSQRSSGDGEIQPGRRGGRCFAGNRTSSIRPLLRRNDDRRLGSCCRCAATTGFSTRRRQATSTS